MSQLDNLRSQESQESQDSWRSQTCQHLERASMPAWQHLPAPSAPGRWRCHPDQRGWRWWSSQWSAGRERICLRRVETEHNLHRLPAGAQTAPHRPPETEIAQPAASAGSEPAGSCCPQRLDSKAATSKAVHVRANQAQHEHLRVADASILGQHIAARPKVGQPLVQAQPSLGGRHVVARGEAGEEVGGDAARLAGLRAARRGGGMDANVGPQSRDQRPAEASRHAAGAADAVAGRGSAQPAGPVCRPGGQSPRRQTQRYQKRGTK